MANEMVLLPRSKYVSLLDNKCTKCEEKPSDSSTSNDLIPAISTDNESKQGESDSSCSSNGIPNTPSNDRESELQQQQQQQQQHINAEPLHESSSSTQSPVHDSSNTANDGPGENIAGLDSSPASDNSDIIHKQSQQEPVTEESLLLKFPAKDVKYAKTILDASKSHPDQLYWDKDGTVIVNGDKLEGSNIYLLVKDTIKDSSVNPVGKFLFYRSLAKIGLKSKDIKNRTNKCFFNAVNGQKIKENCKKKISQGKVNVDDSNVILDKSNEPKNEDSESKLKNVQVDQSTNDKQLDSIKSKPSAWISWNF